MLFIPDEKREKGMAWAQRMLDDPHAAILDTETTGLDKTAQIVQLAIVGIDGQTRYNSLLRPSVLIPPDIVKLHGITNARVRNAPTIIEQVDTFRPIMEAGPVIIYNARYDIRLLRQSLKARGASADWVDALDVHCAMLEYTAYRDAKKWISLAGGSHEAVGDCLATLEVIQNMAKGD